MNASRWWAAAGLVVLAACGDGGQSVAPVSSAGSTSSVAASTVEASTTTTIAIGTWSRRCTEYVRDTPSVPVVDEAALDTFGPLAHEPGLTIELPSVWLSNGWWRLVPTMARVPGGVLVAGSVAAPGFQDPGFEASIVMAVDHDGSVRWVRCLDSTVTVQSYSIEQGLIVVADLEPPHHKEYLPVNLADGTIGEAVAAPPAPAVVDPNVGVNPWESDDFHFQFLDADGGVVWEDLSLGDQMSYEGSFWSTRDGVTVISGVLLPRPAELQTAVTRGYRTRDGRLLWERPSLNVMGPHQDGYILVHSVDINDVGSSAAIWLMLDASTGEPVPGQEWTEFNTFAAGCCDDRLTVTAVAGGVVLHSDGDHENPTTIRVYYPIDAGVTPQSVDVP